MGADSCQMYASIDDLKCDSPVPRQNPVHLLLCADTYYRFLGDEAIRAAD